MGNMRGWKNCDMAVTVNNLPKVERACKCVQIDVPFPLISDEMVSFTSQPRPYTVKDTKLHCLTEEAPKDDLSKEIAARQKHDFRGPPFDIRLYEHSQLKALAANSQTDLKSRNQICIAFIAAFLSAFSVDTFIKTQDIMPL